MDAQKMTDEKNTKKGNKIFDIMFTIIIIVAAVYCGLKYYMAHANVPTFEVDGIEFNMNMKPSELEEKGIRFSSDISANASLPSNSWSSIGYEMKTGEGTSFDLYLYNSSPNSDKVTGECSIYKLSCYIMIGGKEADNVKLNGVDFIGKTADEVKEIMSSATLTYDSGDGGSWRNLTFEKAGYTYEFELGDESAYGNYDSQYRVEHFVVEKDINKGYEPAY